MDILSKIKQAVLWLNQRVEHTGAQYFAFGMFGIINYPLSYLMWHDVMHTYNPLSLRILAALLCIPLLFHNFWSTRLKIYLPVYWYITILYCCPFFETFILLMNHNTSAWLINMVLALFLFIMLVDWLMFILLSILGISLAWLLYNWVGHGVYSFEPGVLSLAKYMLVVSLVIGIVFSRNKEKLAYEKLQSMKSTAANIAHELRTPLAAINAGVSGIADYLPDLIRVYEMARDQQLNIPVIRPYQFDELKTVVQSIETEIRLANTVINTLLVNVSRQKIEIKNLELCSMKHCIDEALRRYPFSEEIKHKIIWEESNDFLFKGQVLLMVHLLFNLLKNAIYYLKNSTKGEIKIWLELGQKYNKLYFLDTGEGIDSRILPYIFERFYSKTHHGNGVGLAFCREVMRNYGGDIVCRSVKGQFTEFVLKFPQCQEV